MTSFTLIPREGNPSITEKGIETDQRIKGPHLKIQGPGGSVAFKADTGQEIIVAVPPLDLLEFRARLPLHKPIGRSLLTEYTLRETMVALALWHLEHTSDFMEAEQHCGNDDPLQDMVQPKDVLSVEPRLREWQKVFQRARKMLGDEC